MKQKLVIYGAGKTAEKIVFDYNCGGLYTPKSQFDIVGFIDDNKIGSFAGLPILGKKEDLPKLLNEGIDNIVVMLLTDTVKRLSLCKEIEQMGFKFPSFHPVLPSNIGKGVYVHESSTFLGIPRQIKDFSIISAYVTLEGGVSIGEGVFICPYVFLGCESEVGDASILYPRSSLKPGIKVGANCIIGPHLYIHKNLSDNSKKLR